MGDQEMTAYLAGDHSAPVTPAQRAELDALRAVLADPAVWIEPDPTLQERIVEAITAANPQTGPSKIGPASARRRRRLGYTLLGVAAALVIAAGVTVGLNQHNGGPAMTYAADLAGTPLAVGASGQVTLTQTSSGWQIVLHATGLPRRDHGDYYQAWLKSAAGVLVPIGTFNEPAQVTLWAGVPPSDYPILTITQQQANGNPASTGLVVLKGTTHQVN